MQKILLSILCAIAFSASMPAFAGHAMSKSEALQDARAVGFEVALADACKVPEALLDKFSTKLSNSFALISDSLYGTLTNDELKAALEDGVVTFGQEHPGKPTKKECREVVRHIKSVINQ